MTVADIVAVAAITRESFYELFRNKEEAFLATQEMGLQESVSGAAAAFFAGPTWPDRVWEGLSALLSYIAVQPNLVYVDLLESSAAGSAALRRSFDNRMAYTLFLEDGYRQRPEAEGLPRLCSAAIGGAILELMRHQVVAGRSERMLEVLPQAAYVSLAPFIGPVSALEVVEGKVATARSGTPSGRSPAPPAAG
jgi:AcrR family transcriptional regulator